MVDEPSRLRADARRNRERLIDVARTALAAGDDTALETIAKRAGVGIGTLYRHFPTRDALVEAVYRTELEAVCALVPQLLAEHPPAVALRSWLDRYSVFLAAKRGMADALARLITSGAVAGTRDRVDAAMARILTAGAAAGDLRADVDPDDAVSSMLGVFLATAEPGREEQRGRMLDLLVDALRPREPVSAAR